MAPVILPLCFFTFIVLVDFIIEWFLRSSRLQSTQFTRRFHKQVNKDTVPSDSTNQPRDLRSVFGKQPAKFGMFLLINSYLSFCLLYYLFALYFKLFPIHISNLLIILVHTFNYFLSLFLVVGVSFFTNTN